MDTLHKTPQKRFSSLEKLAIYAVFLFGPTAVAVPATLALTGELPPIKKVLVIGSVLAPLALFHARDTLNNMR